MLEAYKDYWLNYIDFKGKTSVKDYWLAFLANFIASFLVALVSALANRNNVRDSVVVLYSFIMLCMTPSLAIMIRRFNDAGEPWQNIFWLFLPVAGAIIVVIKLCKPAGQQHSMAASAKNIIDAPLKPRIFQKTGFVKVPKYSLKKYSGNGICDVCSASLSGRDAYIVPNNIFYSSPEYREYFKNINSFMFSIQGIDALKALSMMQASDKSAGSAVCENCIHMFADE